MLGSCSYSYLESHANIQTRTGLSSQPPSFVSNQGCSLRLNFFQYSGYTPTMGGSIHALRHPNQPPSQNISISPTTYHPTFSPSQPPPPRFTSTLQSLCRKPAQVASLIQPSQLATITPEDRRHKGEKNSPNPQHPSQTPCPHRISLFPFDPRHLSPLFPTASLPRFSHRQHAHSRPSSSNRHPGNGQTLVGPSLTR